MTPSQRIRQTGGLTRQWIISLVSFVCSMWSMRIQVPTPGSSRTNSPSTAHRLSGCCAYRNSQAASCVSQTPSFVPVSSPHPRRAHEGEPAGRSHRPRRYRPPPGHALPGRGLQEHLARRPICSSPATTRRPRCRSPSSRRASAGSRSSIWATSATRAAYGIGEGVRAADARSRARAQPGGCFQRANAAFGFAERGSRTVKLVPAPSLDCTPISPPWA